MSTFARYLPISRLITIIESSPAPHDERTSGPPAKARSGEPASGDSIPRSPEPDPPSAGFDSNGADPDSNGADPDSKGADPDSKGAGEERKETPVRRAASTESHPSPSLDELLLFFPVRYPSGNWRPEGLHFADVWFEADDRTRLHGWYCPCENPRAVILFAHGNAGNLSHRSRRLAHLQRHMRVTVLIFDYRGYGRSEGTPSVDGILRDARAARAFLSRQSGAKQSDIVLMGRSLGGAVVTQLAAEDPPRGLILESTFSSIKDVASKHYPHLAWLVPSGKLNSAARITRYKGPLLQSHGDADRTIPFASATKLFRAANEPKQFIRIAGADHNDGQSGEYTRQLDRFISSLPAIQTTE